MNAKLNKVSNQTILTLEEAKEHLRILHNYEDVYINSLLEVVTNTLENELEIDFVDTDYILSIYGNVNLSEKILFPNSPISSLSEIRIYLNGDLVGTNFQYTNSDEFVIFNELPVEFDRIEVQYKKGYENKTDVPKAIKQAALLVLTDLYLNRGTFVIGKSVVYLQKTVDRLLQPYRKVRFT